jgi:3-hydroxyacyl-CoA dehydrogenase
MKGSARQHRTVAVVGTGVIGRSWVRVFARAGLEVRIWDADPDQIEAAWEWFKVDLKRVRKQLGLRKAAVRGERENVTRCASLEEALAGATYVQESGPELLDLKQELYRSLDAVADPRAILASSTSALDMTRIAEGLEGATRCVVAHPVNPPHVVPVVEVLGGERTDPRVVRRTMRFLERVGQTPVLLRRYVPGFALNRLQAALVREALNLVADGVASVDAVDTIIRDGLGLRWAMMGPFGVANTNADGGVREYFERFGRSFQSLWDDLRTDTSITPELLERLQKAVDIMYRRVPPEVQQQWRDDMVGRLRRLKAAHPLGVEPVEEG